MNTITHAILALALSEAFMLNPLVTTISAILPDIDSLIGITHRTITHSLLFMLITSLIIYKIKGIRLTYAFIIGFSSHLITDSITPMGIPLFYPLETYYSFNLVNWDDLITNLGIILASALVIINKNKIHEYLLSLKKGRALLSVNIFIIAWFLVLIFFPVKGCIGDLEKINTLLNIMPGETGALINGTICSNITIEKSNAGNEYQVFTLCDNTGNITVYKGAWIMDNNLSIGDNVLICGVFTRKYSKPEIYYVTNVTK